MSGPWYNISEVTGDALCDQCSDRAVVIYPEGGGDCFECVDLAIIAELGLTADSPVQLYQGRS